MSAAGLPCILRPYGLEDLPVYRPPRTEPGGGDPKPDDPGAAPYRVKRWVGFGGPSVSPVPRGPVLFEEVREVIREHHHFDEDWCYDIAALWVLQCYLVSGLNSVFYLFLGGTMGGGKTTLQDLLARLASALNASDISVAALVHYLNGTSSGAILIDEFDVERDSERDSALAAVARNGNTRGKPYIRYNIKLQDNEECETFGPKLLAFRGAVDPALEDRGLHLPCASYIGGGGFRYVQVNDGLELGSLPARLKEWGHEDSITRARIRAEFKHPAWEAKVRNVVGDRIGANRESQLASIALQVCRFACIDLTESLRIALGVRRTTAAANAPRGLEEAEEVLEELIHGQVTLTERLAFYVVRQKDFTDRLRARIVAAGERSFSSGQVARLRHDLGIKDTWLSRPQNRVTWNIPIAEWEARHPSLVPVANSTNQANLPEDDGGVRPVRSVRPVEGTSGGVQEDLKLDRTKTDLLRGGGGGGPP